VSPHLVELIEFVLIQINVSVFIILSHKTHHLLLLEVYLAPLEFVVDSIHHILDFLDTQHPILVDIVLIEQFIQHLAHFLFTTCYMFHLFPILEDDIPMLVA
jgi:hypothetical protein